MLQISLEEKYDIQIIFKIVQNGTPTQNLHVMCRWSFLNQSGKRLTNKNNPRLNVSTKNTISNP